MAKRAKKLTIAEREKDLLKNADLLQEHTDGLLEYAKMVKRTLEEANKTSFERSIEFPQEYKQAGISLLSEFANILEREHAGESISVSIIQKGTSVTLRITRPDGDIREIEKRLEIYGSVLRGEISVEKFTKDKLLIQELKTRFELVALELRLTRDRYLEYRSDKAAEISALKMQLENLKEIVATALTGQSSLSLLIRTLASQNFVNEKVLSKLTEMVSLSTASQTKLNEEILKGLLLDVRKKDPSFFQKMIDELASIPAAVAGNLATPWFQSILSSLPKV